MKVDAHQHFWNYSLKDYGWISDSMEEIQRSFSPKDLAPVLKKNGIDGCVSVQARQSLEENEYLLGLAEEHDFIKGVVGWVDFQAKDIENQLVAYQSRPNMKGFRHVIQSEPKDDFMLTPAFIDGVKLCEKFGYTYDLLIFEKHLNTTATFLSHFSDQAFVLDHIAKPQIASVLTQNWEQGIRRIAQYEHLYCKVSGMVTEANWKNWKYEDFLPFLEIVFDAFGVDRIMFGSDWPVCLVASDDYMEMKGIFDRFASQFSAEDQAKIYGENAIKFYKL